MTILLGFGIVNDAGMGGEGFAGEHGEGVLLDPVYTGKAMV